MSRLGVCSHGATHNGVRPLHSSNRMTQEFTMISFRFPLRHLVLIAAASLLGATAAMAASADTPSDAQTRYRHDMAVCTSGQSNQAIATCRLEATNALAAARRGSLSAAAPDQYQENALQRCDAHQGDDRIACVARILGEGNVESGVMDGGLLRKSILVVPAN